MLTFNTSSIKQRQHSNQPKQPSFQGEKWLQIIDKQGNPLDTFQLAENTTLKEDQTRFKEVADKVKDIAKNNETSKLQLQKMQDSVGNIITNFMIPLKDNKTLLLSLIAENFLLEDEQGNQTQSRMYSKLAIGGPKESGEICGKPVDKVPITTIDLINPVETDDNTQKDNFSSLMLPEFQTLLSGLAKEEHRQRVELTKGQLEKSYFLSDEYKNKPSGEKAYLEKCFDSWKPSKPDLPKLIPSQDPDIGNIKDSLEKDRVNKSGNKDNALQESLKEHVNQITQKLEDINADSKPPENHMNVKKTRPQKPIHDNAEQAVNLFDVVGGVKASLSNLINTSRNRKND